MKVNELRPGMRKVDVIVRVVRKEKPRRVFVKRDGKYHEVAELLVGDDTGTISMSLWDETIHQIQEDDVIQITNGYISEFGGKMQLNIGRYGRWIRLDANEYDIEVYLEEVEPPVSTKPSEFMKVSECLSRQAGINLLVRIIDRKMPREVTTKFDQKRHIINTFVIGDETGCINFDLWDTGDDIDVGDVIEIHGAYTREFNNILSLNLSRKGSYQKSSEEIPDVNTERNLSKPST
ncbi:MAG: hypothetical protein ACTSYB_12340 [Candidatus Helarchaeota archaeon]